VGASCLSREAEGGVGESRRARVGVG
jgi:hypothetical protein